MSDQEQERLRKLRERQIADRDPLVKQNKVQRGISTKAKRMRKPFKLGGAWKDIPHVIRTPIYALLAGILLTIILPMIWASPYAFWAALLATILLIIFAILVGSNLDLRDDIKNHLR